MLGPRNGIALSLVLGLFPFGFVCGSGNWSLELEELAPGVYMHQGRHVSLESSRRGDSANIGFIAGEQCVAVVDSGGAFQVGRWLAREIRSGSVNPCVISSIRMCLLIMYWVTQHFLTPR